MITLDTNISVGSPGGKATTQLSHLFNSFCQFGGRYLGCDGLRICEIGGTSGGKDTVSSYFETFITKLGYDGNKRLRFIYTGIETFGKIKVTPYMDDVAQAPIIFSGATTGKQYMRMPVNRAKGGAYVKFIVENVAGCWFAIDQVSVLPIYLPRGRK